MATVATTRSSATPFWAAVAIGAAVSVALGVYANVHDASAEVLFTWGFQDQITFKVWFTTAVLVLAVLQLLSAAWMYGKFGASSPSWVGPMHRLLGIAAFVVSLPVAFHCLWSLGFRTGAGWRPYLHSLLGCTFYGVFTLKVLCVRSHRMPGWSLPIVGGLLFAVLAGLWATSALWFFTTAGFPGMVTAKRSVLKTVVSVAEILALVAAGVFVVLLLAKPTAGATPAAPAPAAGGAVAADGAAIYRANCASCHGADGGGRLGPQLADRVVSRFPDPAAQALVVTDGQGGMPAFGSRLTPEQIAAVVEYTRSGLG